MPRIILVDDSASVRTVLAAKLRAHAYEVEEFPDAASAAERAMQHPPSAVVTDLIMPGMSGVQLCRLLQAEPSTASVPVVLLTAAGDRRSRFWARSAGAVAYVSKTEASALIDILPQVLKGATTSPPVAGAGTSRGMVQERLSQLLDRALFDSVIQGEVRALASAGDLQKLFADFSALVSEVLTYRWLALKAEMDQSPVMVHAHPSRAETCELDARGALGVPQDRAVTTILDDRAASDEGPAPFVVPIFFGSQKVGELAVGPTMRGFGRDDKKLATLVALELAGPLRMAALVDETRRMAATDALTGLLNRRAFIDAMDRERSRAKRHSLPIAVLLVDIDHFKRINDTHGHSAGDAALSAVARVLNGVARKSDFLGRWGGEEFVLGLPQTGESGARVAAERVRRAIEGATIALPDRKTLSITASVGLATADTPWVLDELVERADQAMYAAKARGRNRVEIWRPPSS